MQGQSTEMKQERPIDALRSTVEAFLAKHPQVSVQALATRSNVPVTSLRRLLNDAGKADIAPHTALNLCAYIHRERKIHKLLQVVDQVLADFLRSHFGHFVFEDSQRVFDLDLNELLQDRMNYFIYKLAANRAGTSLMEVTELFGALGKKKVTELIKKGALLESEERLHAKDKNFSLDVKIAAGHLPDLVSFYKPEEIARGLNLFYSLSESLSEEAIKQVKDVQREAVKKIHSIMNDEKSAGPIPYFTLNLAETFLPEQQGVLQ